MATSEIVSLDRPPSSSSVASAPGSQVTTSTASPSEETRTSASAGIAAAQSSRTDAIDRKSTRLNSSHSQISYAVFCLKKKKKKKITQKTPHRRVHNNILTKLSR